jgi:hypothetical protein
MKSFSILLSIALLSLSSSLRAGTITLSSVGGSQFADKSGALIAQGCAVRVGSFSVPSSTLTSTGDYGQLKTLFKPLAEGIVGAGSTVQSGGAGTVLRENCFPGPGDIFGSVSDISATYLPPDTQVYVWVFNNADPNLATQWGLFTAATWTAPPALGNRTLSTVDVQTLQGTANGNQLRLIDVPATYGNWAWQNYSVNASGALTNPAADPDGNGLANIAEYAWQLNPAAHSGPRTAIAANGATVTFTFKSPRNITDVTVSAECSADLKNWSPAPSTVVASDANFDTCECTSTSGTQCFWRVRFDPVP